MVLFLWEVAAILGNGYRIQGKNYVALIQGEVRCQQVSLQEFDIRYIMF